MARAHGIVLLAVIGSGTALWLWFAAQQPMAPPPPPEPAAPAPGSTAPDAPARSPLPPPTAPPQTPLAPAPPPSRPPPAVPVASDAALRVQLLVRDLQTKADLAAFRWRFRGDRPLPGDAWTTNGEGHRGAADLDLPLLPGELLVEADGYAPERVAIAVPARATQPLRIEAFLGLQPPLAGVVLQCVDDQGWPVRRLRLDVWQLAAAAPDPPPDADPDGQPLWSRTGTSDDGRFQLPPLPAGRFALRAQPFDDHDEPAPLLPWRQTFAFAGHESLPFHVAFAPGMLLALEAPPEAAPQDYAVFVRGGAGTAVPVLWRSRSGEAAVVARDRARLPPRATVLLPLPPGDYQLELWRGEQQLRTTRTVAGRIATFTIGEPR